MQEELVKLIRGYALKDAVLHDGKAKVGSVMSKLLADRPELKSRAREIARIAAKIVEDVNKLALAEQKRILEEEYSWLLQTPRKKTEEGGGLPPLPNAVEGKVVTRFAPNPDFVIHLGNARPAILSDEYAKMYKGRMILRFEDTDPRTKKPMKEAYDLIKEDLRWLGVVWHEEYIQSLRMEVYYNIIKEMIKRGCAYIDLCKESSRELLRKGEYCQTRDNPPEWHLEQFEKMLNREYYEGEAVVRIKTDPKHPNPSIRDWVALRIIDTEKYPHPIVGSKYWVWPTYNFAVSVDDHLMGVTHILRGKEHQVNTEKQLYVYKCMGWEPPTFIHFGRLKLEGFIMSKSYIRRLIEENPDKFLGFDDPRFGTIAGLRRRGILPEAIREIILTVGIKPGDAKISWKNLAATNRKLLDPIADRIMYVEDYIKMTVKSPTCLHGRIPYHPDRPERVRKIMVCGGDNVFLQKADIEKYDELRLLGLGNFRVNREKNELELISTELEYARSRKLPIVQFVPERGAVNVKVLIPEGLELKVKEGLAEPALLEYSVDDRLQFMRYGFVRIDKIGEKNGKIYNVIYTHS
ncbi:MAG: glutamate--tRNA ligase [Desulfurococcales archaeon]|nr:glutamate--tRNA ligase [Desulfurococcales archaeon]